MKLHNYIMTNTIVLYTGQFYINTAKLQKFYKIMSTLLSQMAYFRMGFMLSVNAIQSSSVLTQWSCL